MKTHRLSGIVTIAGNGAIVSVLSIAYAVSTAAFVFSGALAPGMGYAVASVLCATAISGAIFAWRSEVPFAIGGVDNRSAAALAVALAPLGAAGAASVPTALIASAVATLLTAAVMFLLARFRAGALIRYMPYPVIGAVSAGSSVLMAQSGAHMVFAHTPVLIATVAFAAVLVALERWRGPLPVTVSVLLAVFAPIVAVRFGISEQTLLNGGWLIDAPHVSLWLPGAHLTQVSWPAMLHVLPALFAVAAISAVSVLFNAASLERFAHGDIDMGQQLKLSAVSNVAGGVLGAMVAFTSFSRSAMNVQAGTRSRAVGYLGAAVVMLALFVGGSMLVNLSVVVPGALLISGGASIAFEWLVRSRRRMSTPEFATIWLLVVSIVLWGFVVGIIVGVVVTCVTFALRYARTDAIERRATLATCRSTLQRSIRETVVLGMHGERAGVYFLRGWLFFGVAERIIAS